jgi:cytochrome c peroxidase
MEAAMRTILTKLLIASVAFLQFSIVCSTAQNSEERKIVVRLDQGWSEDTAKLWYHISQGTALVPYEWLLALERPDSSELLSSADSMQRFGFLVDPSGSPNSLDALPVGFSKMTLDLDQDGYRCWKGNWAGLGCAACHTGQIDYQGQRIRIEGGPAHIDIEDFVKTIGNSFEDMNKDQAKFLRFADRVIDSKSSLSKPELLNNVSCYGNALKSRKEFIDRGEYQSREKSVPSGFGRLDAHGIGLNLLVSELIRALVNYVPPTAPVRYPALWDTPYFSWVLYNASIRQPLARNVIEALGVQAPMKPDTMLGPNVVHSVNMDNLVWGQLKVMELRSPVWPEGIFGKLDYKKAARGKELYDRLCVMCHQVVDRAAHTVQSNAAKSGRDISIPVFDLETIKTDPRQAQTFENRKVSLEMINGPPDLMAYEVGRYVTDKIVQQWIGQSPLHVTAANEINFGRPNEFRAPLGYRARPLNGIWSTAPYLHNGSVPSLYELLLPAERRSKTFYVGIWEFNPRTVGFDTVNAATDTWVLKAFDTTTMGNSNSGHEYGTELQDSDRWDLIEYLKTL